MNAQQAGVVLTRFLGALIVVYALVGAANTLRGLAQMGWTLTPSWTYYGPDGTAMTVNPEDPDAFVSNLILTLRPWGVLALGVGCIFYTRGLARSTPAEPTAPSGGKETS